MVSRAVQQAVFLTELGTRISLAKNTANRNLLPHRHAGLLSYVSYCFEALLIRRIEFRMIVLIIRTKLTAERDPRCPRMGRSRGPFLLDPPLHM